MTNEEEWKPIPGLGGNYLVSNWGHVKRLAHDIIIRHGVRRPLKAKMLSTKRNRDYGYILVSIKAKGRLLHHLVLEAFVGPRPEGMIALHKDDDPTNNKLSNLRWGTRKENAKDSKVNKKKKDFVSQHHRRYEDTEKSMVYLLIRKDVQKQIRQIAEERTPSGERVNVSLYYREAIRQYIAGWQATMSTRGEG